MGKQMSMRELRAALSKIEHELAEHGEIELTRNGAVVARLVPESTQTRPRYTGNTAFRQTISRPKVSIEEMLDDIRGPR